MADIKNPDGAQQITSKVWGVLVLSGRVTRLSDSEGFEEWSNVARIGYLGSRWVTSARLFTTPGEGEPADGFPALSRTGGFVLKDIPLLGFSFSTLADAPPANRRSRHTANSKAVALDICGLTGPLSGSTQPSATGELTGENPDNTDRSL